MLYRSDIKNDFAQVARKKEKKKQEKCFRGNIVQNGFFFVVVPESPVLTEQLREMILPILNLGI